MILKRLNNKQLSQLLGDVLLLVMASKIHRRFPIQDFVELIMPALDSNQFRIYKNDKGDPIGLVTWAKFSDEMEKKLHAGQILFTPEEWQSGDKLYFMDFIAPYGHARKMVHDLKNNIFPNDVGYTIRFKELGKPSHRISKFYGINSKN